MAVTVPDGVLCAGNIVYDILARPADSFKWGGTAWVDSIDPHLGGNGANTSYALAKLGAPVRLLSIVGTDDFGGYCIGRLEGVGVDVSRVERSPEQTATTVGLVQANGVRALLHRPGASHFAFAAPIVFDTALTRGFSHFHLGNPFGLPGIRAQTAATLARARAAGLTTSCDTGWDALGEWMTLLGPCLPSIDLLFVNEDEAGMLTGAGGPAEAAAAFFDGGAAGIVIKLGGRGCVVFAGGAEIRVPAYPVEVKDTTGAGDCFAGGFLAALHRGADYESAARFASAVGALNVRSIGSTEGLLSYEETLRWMDHDSLTG